MRPLPLFFALALASSLSAAEPYPLWDGHEPIADYARRVTLPPTKTLDLGDNVKLELVLIPGVRFVWGLRSVVLPPTAAQSTGPAHAGSPRSSIRSCGAACPARATAGA